MMRTALLAACCVLLPSCATSLYVDWMQRDDTRPEYVAEFRRDTSGNVVETVTRPWPSDQHVSAVFCAPLVLPLALAWDVVTLPLQAVYRLGPFAKPGAQ